MLDLLASENPATSHALFGSTWNILSNSCRLTVPSGAELLSKVVVSRLAVFMWPESIPWFSPGMWESEGTTSAPLMVAHPFELIELEDGLVGAGKTWLLLPTIVAEKDDFGDMAAAVSARMLNDSACWELRVLLVTVTCRHFRWALTHTIVHFLHLGNVESASLHCFHWPCAPISVRFLFLGAATQSFQYLQ